MQTSNDVSTHDVLRTARRAQWMAGIALALLVIGFATIQIDIWIRMEFHRVMRLHVRQSEAGDLQMSGKDMAYVVTHLRTQEDKIAVLIPLIVSGHENYGRQQITRLDWRDENGKKTAPPSPKEELEVLYFRPQSTRKVK